jgi:glycosyltransferase involved in cell wall biosynthesis
VSGSQIRRSEGDLNRLRIAYFSPLPPERSGIADYSRELLPYLAQQAEVILYAADPGHVTEEMKTQFEVRDLSRFEQEHRQFDMALYQMGNSEYHASFYPILTHFPGVVVLHDYGIHHFIAHRTLTQGDFAGYAREMGYALGARGMHLAHAIRLGQAPSAVYEAALNDRVLSSSLGLIVHSAYVADKVRQRGFDRPLTIIPALIEEHPGRSRRDELNLPEDAVLFASFGVITKQKQIEMALRAFRTVRESVPNARYLLVGEALVDMDLKALIEELNLVGPVIQVGYVPDLNLFVDWVHTADVVINLRDPTVGETSATALRAMAAGRPLIVFDHGWYREIPDEATIKTEPLDEEMLVTAMLRLAGSSQLREQMGRAGQRYTREVCHPAAVAEAYVRTLSSTLDVYLEPYE